jgi:steroid delta-isomerase-like uncharacterized protein
VRPTPRKTVKLTFSLFWQGIINVNNKEQYMNQNLELAIEQNKTAYRRFIQVVFNEGRLDILEQLLSPSYIYQDAPPGTPPNADGIRQVVTNARTAFPDLKITIEDMVGEGDKVCARLSTRGTHRGVFFDILPTGKTIFMKGMTMIHFIDGRMVASWVLNDVMGLMSQLGAGSKNKLD